MKLKISIKFQPLPDKDCEINHQPLVDWFGLLLEEQEMKDVCEKEGKCKEARGEGAEKLKGNRKK
ncbi:hypothetical protein KKA53_03420 [Candidatus Dependentiae bacterium]|nr:hypothetical protein [Candidatus Dependentiae bacterium]